MAQDRRSSNATLTRSLMPNVLGFPPDFQRLRASLHPQQEYTQVVREERTMTQRSDTSVNGTRHSDLIEVKTPKLIAGTPHHYIPTPDQPIAIVAASDDPPPVITTAASEGPPPPASLSSL